MKLHVIGSNSAGNAYILEASTGECILLECGVRFEKIKQALGFNLAKVKACLVSHEHLDHCKAVNDVLAAGISVYSSDGTHRAMGTEGHHRSRRLAMMTQVILGDFKVKCFDIKHDCCEPVGFLINHPECGTVLFLTDSYYCEYNFKG